MEHPQPWTDTILLARVLANWRQQYAGREIFRVSAGDNWLRLHLAGDDRVALLLSHVPGARLVCRQVGKPPEALTDALAPHRNHPLQELLTGARLVACGLLPDDRIAAFHLARETGPDLVLLHRLYGARGNCTLLDRQLRLLWSVHRPPGPALAAWPPAATFTGGLDGPAPAAYDNLARDELARAAADLVLTRNRSALGRRRKIVDRLVENLARDLANADQGENHRRKAEALAANLHTLRQGAAEIELADLTDASPLHIALDPARSPAANMEAWFRRARKADKGREIIRARHDEAVAAGAALYEAGERLLQAAGDSATPLERLANLWQWRQENADLFPAGTTRSRAHAPEEPSRPFRRYLIDGQWEVWVGRNNKENDELTHRAAHNRDIWLHAQGVSGSHVIVRTGGHPERVPRPVLEKAAALAALNSKGRHAGLVPVIHTEKRYVRKPRKAPAGTAVCLQDRSLFVAPGIMPGVEPA